MHYPHAGQNPTFQKGRKLEANFTTLKVKLLGLLVKQIPWKGMAECEMVSTEREIESQKYIMVIMAPLKQTF